MRVTIRKEKEGSLYNTSLCGSCRSINSTYVLLIKCDICRYRIKQLKRNILRNIMLIGANVTTWGFCCCYYSRTKKHFNTQQHQHNITIVITVWILIHLSHNGYAKQCFNLFLIIVMAGNIYMKRHLWKSSTNLKSRQNLQTL